MLNENDPGILILNQMAGPMTRELAEDLGDSFGSAALLTGHPDTLTKGSLRSVRLYAAVAYDRRSYVRRLGSWIRYLAGAFLWLWRWPADIPVLLFTNPPLLPWLGLLMRGLRGQRFAVMVHDIYPDVLVQTETLSPRNPVVRMWRWLNRMAYERADLIMTLGEHMADKLSEQFDATRTQAERIRVVYPWADSHTIRSIPKEENWFAKKYDQVGKTTVMYSGNLGIGHDIETILAGAESLQSEPAIHFMFVGAGPKWELVREAIDKGGRTNITLLPWQSEESFPDVLATADVAVVSLQSRLSGLAVPSRAFSFLAAGVPLIVLGDTQTELASLIERFDCGHVVSPKNIQGLHDVLLELKNDRAKLTTLKLQSRRASEHVGSRANSYRIVDLLRSYTSSPVTD